MLLPRLLRSAMPGRGPAVVAAAHGGVGAGVQLPLAIEVVVKAHKGAVLQFIVVGKI